MEGSLFFVVVVIKQFDCFRSHSCGFVVFHD